MLKNEYECIIRPLTYHLPKDQRTDEVHELEASKNKADRCRWHILAGCLLK